MPHVSNITTAKRTSVSTVASSLALTPRRIQQLVKEKILPAPDNGNYDLKACIIAYKKYLQIQSDRKAGNIIANNKNKNTNINSDYNPNANVMDRIRAHFDAKETSCLVPHCAGADQL